MSRHTKNPLSSIRRLAASALACALLSAATPLLAADDFQLEKHYGNYCSATAALQFVACKSEIRDDYLVGKAICLNVSDAAERGECFDEAWATFREERALCQDQRAARFDLCDAIGEERYDPDFDPATFDADFTQLTNPNPYRPLAIGNVWEYASEDETTVIEVLDETKLIDGVTCIVVNDAVSEDGDLIENTDDWFAQHVDGSVYYCGEIVNDFETFDGDTPADPELVSIEGSFKAGRDGDKAGILFPGSPIVGQTYRQEWSASNAEDAATVLSTSYSFGNDPELDESAPQELVELLCHGDCVVTAEFTPMEPGVLEHKYFAPGIGLFLEVKPEDGEVAQLVGCNFDSRCDLLPEP